MRPAANTGVSRESLEVLGPVPEAHASIAFAMGVATLEALTAVAKHQRARCHQRAPNGRPVLKAARQHDGDGIARMLFFEGPIVGPGRTNHIGHRPPIAGGDDER